jgi:hypothetical protein
METQITFYKVMAVFAGLCGSESWVLREEDINRVQAAEMSCLRLALGVTRQNKLTNEATTKMLKVNSLKNIISA